MIFSKYSIECIHTHCKDVADSIDSSATHLAVYKDSIERQQTIYSEDIFNYTLLSALHLSNILLAIPLSALTFDAQSSDGLSETFSKHPIIEPTRTNIDTILTRLGQIYQYPGMHMSATHDHIPHHLRAIESVNDLLKAFAESFDSDSLDTHSIVTHIFNECIDLRHDFLNTLKVLPSLNIHNCLAAYKYDNLRYDRSHSCYRIDYDERNSRAKTNIESGTLMIQEQHILHYALSASRTRQANLSTVIFQ